MYLPARLMVSKDSVSKRANHCSPPSSGVFGAMSVSQHSCHVTLCRLPLREKGEHSPWGDTSDDVTADAVLQVICEV